MAMFDFNPLSDIGNLLGGVSSAYSAFNAGNLLEKQFNLQKDLYKYQNDINVDNYKHRHQWEVEDLQSAGLNPILSANSGGSIASANGNLGNSAMSAEQSRAQHIANMISAMQGLAQTKQMYANSAYLEEQAKTQESVREHLQAQIQNQYAGVNLLNQQAKQVSVNTGLAVKQSENYDRWGLLA